MSEGYTPDGAQASQFCLSRDHQCRDRSRLRRLVRGLRTAVATHRGAPVAEESARFLATNAPKLRREVKRPVPRFLPKSKPGGRNTAQARRSASPTTLTLRTNLTPSIGCAVGQKPAATLYRPQPCRCGKGRSQGGKGGCWDGDQTIFVGITVLLGLDPSDPFPTRGQSANPAQRRDGGTTSAPKSKLAEWGLSSVRLTTTPSGIQARLHPALPPCRFPQPTGDILVPSYQPDEADLMEQDSPSLDLSVDVAAQVLRGVDTATRGVECSMHNPAKQPEMDEDGPGHLRRPR